MDDQALMGVKVYTIESEMTEEEYNQQDFNHNLPTPTSSPSIQCVGGTPPPAPAPTPVPNPSDCAHPPYPP